MRRTRRNHAAGFKAKVAIAAIKGDKTLAESDNKSNSRTVAGEAMSTCWMWHTLNNILPAGSATNARACTDAPDRQNLGHPQSWDGLLQTTCGQHYVLVRYKWPFGAENRNLAYFITRIGVANMPAMNNRGHLSIMKIE